MVSITLRWFGSKGRKTVNLICSDSISLMVHKLSKHNKTISEYSSIWKPFYWMLFKRPDTSFPSEIFSSPREVKNEDPDKRGWGNMMMLSKQKGHTAIPCEDNISLLLFSLESLKITETHWPLWISCTLEDLVLVNSCGHAIPQFNNTGYWMRSPLL